MKYIGVPSCPYCKKGVNLIRVWSVKKHGEYMCPRCKGIANIYLSPLTYVFAVLAVAAGILIYFFHKFVIDSINLMTSIYVLIPFALFFLISLFMVYFEKPIIKKVRKTADGRFFDQNGNELKVKMGKLVTAAGNGLQDISPTNGTSLKRPVSQQNYVSQETDQQSPISRETLQAEKVPFADNEGLYAATAKKLGRDFTREFSKDALEQEIKEIQSKVETPRPAQKLLEEEALRKRKQAIMEQAERVALENTTPPVTKSADNTAKPGVTPRPGERPQPIRPIAQRIPRMPTEKQALSVDQTAQESKIRIAKKSEFDNLIEEYDRAAGKIDRTAGASKQNERSSSSFRQL